MKHAAGAGAAPPRHGSSSARGHPTGDGRRDRPGPARTDRGRLVSAGRRLATAADALPVVLLAVIAGAGSFSHIRDTAAQHGQRGPMLAVAVCIDLTCVMAARERQRDKRLGIAVRRLSWPTMVLADGVGLSLAANLAQAQPTAWGQGRGHPAGEVYSSADLHRNGGWLR